MPIAEFAAHQAKPCGLPEKKLLTESDHQKAIMASSPLPRRINVISYNLWLIPFSGAWNFGRVNRCRDRVAFECAKLEREAPSDLQIVALQEAWAFRAGLAYPLLWLMHKFEAFLLGLGLCGGVEPGLWTLAKNAASALAALWAWVPGARRILWCPKWRFVEALGQLGLPWHASGRGAFAAHPNFARPPLLMDSGLLLLGSREPDACGFEGYSRAESSEAPANKGLLWAAFGKLGLVATHMTFQFDDGGASRGRQRAKLANRVAALLGLDADEATPVCDVVIAIAPASFCFRGAARDAKDPAGPRRLQPRAAGADDGRRAGRGARGRQPEHLRPRVAARQRVAGPAAPRSRARRPRGRRAPVAGPADEPGRHGGPRLRRVEARRRRDLRREVHGDHRGPGRGRERPPHDQVRPRAAITVLTRR